MIARQNLEAQYEIPELRVRPGKQNECRRTLLRDAFLDKSSFREDIFTLPTNKGLFERFALYEFDPKKFLDLSPLDVNRSILFHELQEFMAVSYLNSEDICFFLEEYLGRSSFKLLLICEKKPAPVESFHWFFLLLKFDLKERKTIYQVLNFSSLSQDYILKRITDALDQTQMMSQGEYRLSAYENFYDPKNSFEQAYHNYHYALTVAHSLKLIVDEKFIESVIRQKNQCAVPAITQDILESTAALTKSDLEKDFILYPSLNYKASQSKRG